MRMPTLIVAALLPAAPTLLRAQETAPVAKSPADEEAVAYFDTTFEGRPHRAEYRYLIPAAVPAHAAPNGGAASALAPRPCLLALHGAFLNPRIMMNSLRDAARARGFVVICPKSRGIGWTAGDHAMLDDLWAHLAAGAHGADSARLYLIGFSSGARRAAVYGLLYPARFRAVATFAGMLARDDLPADFDPRPAAELPIILVQGDRDPLVPPATGRAMHAFLQTLGCRRVAYHELPGVTHTVPASMLPTMFAFFDAAAPAPDAPAPSDRSADDPPAPAGEEF